MVKSEKAAILYVAGIIKEGINENTLSIVKEEMMVLDNKGYHKADLLLSYTIHDFLTTPVAKIFEPELGETLTLAKLPVTEKIFVNNAEKIATEGIESVV